MEAIYLQETEHTPKIIIDPEKKLFEISGRSLPEEVMDVYQQVLEWIDKNAKKVVEENYNIKINLFYYNSPTARVLHKIFKNLEPHYQGQSGFSIQWFYEFDEEMEDAQDLTEEIKLPFTFVKTEDEN